MKPSTINLRPKTRFNVIKNSLVTQLVKHNIDDMLMEKILYTTAGIK